MTISPVPPPPFSGDESIAGIIQWLIQLLQWFAAKMAAGAELSLETSPGEDTRTARTETGQPDAAENATQDAAMRETPIAHRRCGRDGGGAAPARAASGGWSAAVEDVAPAKVAISRAIRLIGLNRPVALNTDWEAAPCRVGILGGVSARRGMGASRDGPDDPDHAFGLRTMPPWRVHFVTLSQ